MILEKIIQMKIFVFDILLDIIPYMKKSLRMGQIKYLIWTAAE